MMSLVACVLELVVVWPSYADAAGRGYVHHQMLIVEPQLPGGGVASVTELAVYS